MLILEDSRVLPPPASPPPPAPAAKSPNPAGPAEVRSTVGSPSPGPTKSVSAGSLGARPPPARMATNAPLYALSTWTAPVPPVDTAQKIDRDELTQALQEGGVDLSQLKAEEVTQVFNAARTLRDGSAPEKIDALATLARVVPLDPGSGLRNVAKALKVDNQAVFDVACNPVALKSLSTLIDGQASKADKVAAALTLAHAVGQVAADNPARQAMDRYLKALPAGADVARAVGTWMDPKSSGVEKANAALDIAKAGQVFAGVAAPELKNKLRAADSLTASVGAALTLIDPNTSVADKAQAAIQLAANVPDIQGDVQQLREIFQKHKVPSYEDVLTHAAGSKVLAQLPADVQKSLSPEVAAELSKEELAQLEKLALDEELAPALNKALAGVKSPQAATALLKTLATHEEDAAATKAVLDTLGGMRDGVAEKLLTSEIDGRPAAEVLGNVTAKFDAAERASLKRMLSEFGENESKFLLALAEKDSSGTIQELLKLGDKVDPKIVKRFLGVVEKIVDKTGIQISAEVATKVSKALKAMLPVIGAGQAAKNISELKDIVANKDMPDAIRFLALENSELNAIDFVSSLAEAVDFETGLPVAVDIGLAGAELVLDLVISDQKAKFEADPAGYKTPDWLELANVAIAASRGPWGAADLLTIYGPNGTIDLTGRVARMTGKAAIHATEVALNMPADVLRQDAHAAAESLHLMADVIRNPGKYGKEAERLAKQAVDRLSDLAKSGYEVGKAAAKELKSLVGDLEKLGEKGVKALAWIASHPTEAAADAARALGKLAQQGLHMAGEAGKALTRAALQGLGQARDALVAAGQAVGDAAKAAYQAVSDAVDSTVDAALKAGKAGVEALTWIVNNPGTAAKMVGGALVKAASKVGETAKLAYDTIVSLGEKGVALGKEVVGKLKDLGAAGVDLLTYVAQHPGQVAAAARKAACQALSDFAKQTGEIAEKAAKALVHLVDNGIGEAKDTVKVLLTESKEALKRIAKHWQGELTAGALEVIGGLKDLGDAGKDAAKNLAGEGVDAAKAVWHAFEDGANWVVKHVPLPPNPLSVFG
jgi:hypothetical protein